MNDEYFQEWKDWVNSHKNANGRNLGSVYKALNGHSLAKPS